MHPETHLIEQFRHSQVRSRALAIGAAAFSVAWLLVWYWQTTTSIVAIWYRSETYAHGFVVVPIVIWLIWRDRERLATVPIQPHATALVGLAVAGFGWLTAELASVLGGSQFMLFAMIPLAVWAILGTAMLRALAFPLGFLFFAVPFGDFVVPTLMDWTADFTIAALRATGVPVLREGRTFAIPSGRWSVVEACSGVRYLIASVVVGTLYAYLTYRSLSRRLVFIGFSIVVPLVANWLRAYMIVMIGHLSGNRLAVGVDHIIYGWIFFGVVMLLLFWIASFWRQDETPDRGDALAAVAPGPVAAFSRVAMVMLAVMPLISVWKPALAVLESRNSVTPVELAAIDPAGGWRAQHDTITSFKPNYVNPVAETTQIFAKGAARVGVFVAFYRNQTQASELVSHNNQIVLTGNKQWTELRWGTADAMLADAALHVRTTELRGDAMRLEAWQWYWIDGWLTTSDYAAKAYLAFAKLLGRGDDSAVVVIFTPKDDGSESSDSVLKQFTADMGSSIQHMLRQAEQQ